jgi:hypothetical protein
VRFPLARKWFQESFSGQEDAFLCFGIISLLLPVSLMAQKDAASLEGRVVDARGAVVAQASVTATNVDTTFTYRAESNSRRVGYRPGAYRYVSYSDYSQGIQVIDRGPADTRCTTTAARGRNPGARSSDRKRGSLWHFAVDPDRQASLLRVVVEP